MILNEITLSLIGLETPEMIRDCMSFLCRDLGCALESALMASDSFHCLCFDNFSSDADIFFTSKFQTPSKISVPGSWACYSLP